MKGMEKGGNDEKWFQKRYSIAQKHQGSLLWTRSVWGGGEYFGGGHHSEELSGKTIIARWQVGSGQVKLGEYYSDRLKNESDNLDLWAAVGWDVGWDVSYTNEFDVSTTLRQAIVREIAALSFWDWKLDRGYLVHIKSFPQAPLRCRIEMGRSQKTSMPPWYLGVYLGKEAKPSEMVLFKLCWNAVTNDMELRYGEASIWQPNTSPYPYPYHIICQGPISLAWAGGEERLHLARCLLYSTF